MLLPKQVWACDVVLLQVRVTALKQRAAARCGFPNIVKVL